MTLGAILLFLFVGLPILCGVVVWGFFDAGDRPQEVWTKTGRSRRFWLWAQAVGIFVPPLVTIVYVLAVRPGLERVTPPPAQEGSTSPDGSTAAGPPAAGPPAAGAASGAEPGEEPAARQEGG